MSLRYFAIVMLAICITADQPEVFGQQPKPRQGPESKLGGYEVPPPANNVPDREFDIILGRPTDRGVTARVLAYENLEAQVVFGATAGEYSGKTPLRALNKGEPVDLVIDAQAPNVRCYYRLDYRRAGEPFAHSDEYTFHTQCATNSPFTFTVQSDSHLDENTSPAVYERTLANVLADRPDFHFELGDTFMTDKYVKPELSQPQYLAQRYYFGLLCHSAPLFFALGNHDGELGNKGSNVWATQTRKRYIPNPVPDKFYTGNQAVEPSIGNIEDYYAWKWGNSLFVVLDPFRYTTKRSREKKDNWDRTLGRQQYDWLKTTLAKSDARFKFVFLHHLVGGADQSARGGIEAAPFYEWGGKSSDGKDDFGRMRPGWRQPIHAMLVEHGVSIVFHGHDHLFVKQDLDGIVYQEVPQPGYPRFGNVRSAAEYGYLSGEIQGSSGHIRVNVQNKVVRVDYVRSYLPEQETADRKNGEVTYSYLITDD